MAGTKKRPDSENIAVTAAKAAADKKAICVKVLSASSAWGVADYVVIASGANERHVAAIVDNMEQHLRKKNVLPKATEGYGKTGWVVMDFSDVLVHVFEDTVRERYKVDDIWRESGVKWDDK